MGSPSLLCVGTGNAHGCPAQLALPGTAWLADYSFRSALLCKPLAFQPRDDGNDLWSLIFLNNKARCGNEVCSPPLGPVWLCSQVEVWLNRVLDRMCATLRHEIPEAVVTYEEKPREQWIFDYPAQVWGRWRGAAHPPWVSPLPGVNSCVRQRTTLTWG